MAEHTVIISLSLMNTVTILLLLMNTVTIILSLMDVTTILLSLMNTVIILLSLMNTLIILLLSSSLPFLCILHLKMIGASTQSSYWVSLNNQTVSSLSSFIEDSFFYNVKLKANRKINIF